jgi:hypothetical protein
VATTRVPGTFKLVYLVANTIMNVTTQDDQLAVFANAAAHLEPGGCFVVEVLVPQLRRVPPGQTGWVFTLDPDHVGIETFDDPAAQIAWSHHSIEAGGRLVRHSAPRIAQNEGGSGRCRPAWEQVSLAAGQRGEHGGEDGVGPGVQLVVGQQLDRMGDVDHAGTRHAEPTCLLDGFVGERCRRDADRWDAPALQANQVMQTARRA